MNVPLITFYNITIVFSLFFFNNRNVYIYCLCTIVNNSVKSISEQYNVKDRLGRQF